MHFHYERSAACQRRGTVVAAETAGSSRDWIGSSETHKYPPQIFYSNKGEKFLFQAGETMRIYELPEATRVIYPGVRKDGFTDPDKMRSMVQEALLNPIGQDPLPAKLRALKAAKGNPKILFAFDDVSIPLPPMRSPDIRRLIMEAAEAMCLEAGVTDLEFICSIALHRFIRPDEFRHICGPRLFDKYHPHRMRNYNAVDKYDSVHLGYTRHGEDVEICKSFAEADLVIYANVNYVAMDGGYKSYATGMVHYNSLRHNHDTKTLKATQSLYDPANSAMHKSFYRIGRMMQTHVDIFHVETVLDDQLFPFVLEFVMVLMRQMTLLQKLFMYVSVYGLKLVPLWLRLRIFWFVRGPFGLLQVTAGETQAVHERTLACNYEDKVLDVDGQADILILAPTCVGPYTKDMYINPLLVNTYSLGYYFNMYVDGTPLLRDGGCIIVVSEMHYSWSSPAHDMYRDFFENVIKKAPGLDDFEAFQEQYATDKRLNDIYRQGKGPAAVHGFYMYTWAAHGMDKVGKVFVVEPSDLRGPEILRWEPAADIIQAVAKAKAFLNKPDASVTCFRCPPVGYLRVKKGAAAAGPPAGAAAAEAGVPAGAAEVGAAAAGGRA